MFGLMFIAFIVAIVGLIRPFKGLERKHFGWGAAAAFVGMMIFVPDSEKSTMTAQAEPPPRSLTPEEAAAAKEQNQAEITKLVAEAQALPASDLEANERIYARLASLDPSTPDYAEKQREYAEKIAAAERFEDHPEEALELENLRWEKSGFGSIQLIRFTVKNNAPFAIKDFEVRCTHQGNSGTDMDRNIRTVYELVPANESKRIPEVNMGFIHNQVASSRCEITDAVRA